MPEKIRDRELTLYLRAQKKVFRSVLEVLAWPRSTYYQSLIKTESVRDRENRLLLEQIQLIHAESKGRYGAPKIHFLLLKAGFSVSLKRIQKIIRKRGKYSSMILKFPVQYHIEPI